MTPLREAVVLPAIFLTVALLGGLRVAADVRLLPPPLTALVLAVLLLGTLVRGRAFAPYQLLNGARRPLENTSGAVVLIALFAASAQTINLLVPERGLLHAAFAILIFCQLMTMGAAGTARAGTLRTLLVLLGSLFVLRYIVVEAMYAPDRGLLNRVLTTLMSGATLGGITYEPNAPVTGYLAFVTLILYVLGLLLLPAGPDATALVPRGSHRALVSTAVAVVLLAAGGCGGEMPRSEHAMGGGDPPQTAPAPQRSSTGLVSAALRTAALQRAQVWRAPDPEPRAADLRSNRPGPGAFDESAIVECRLVLKPMGGTTPKFDCEAAGGDILRVKYGKDNEELYGEVAATRLLSALGFYADRMYVVKAVRCAGCPTFPFQSLRCHAETGRERGCFPRGLDYGRATDFDFVVVERRLEGRRIEASPDQGWAWYELDRIDEAAGGAPRAHVDALKLLAIVIAHWDNKSENQRLVCLPGGDLPGGGCSRPLAMLQDLGASFGPVKLDLHNWRSVGVWADPRTCRVSMEGLPWGGGTFPESTISEAGRVFLLKLLEQLSVHQFEQLFSGARIEHSQPMLAEGRQARAWANALQDKVRQIREAGPCPPTSPASK